MERIIGLLKSPSTSLSPSLHEDRHTQISASLAPTSSPRPKMSPLEALPAEIISNILAFLPPVSLAAVLQTSNHLRPHAQNDLLWMTFVKRNLPAESQIQCPSPAKTWKELYAAHHPYWFLTRYKIWFADTPATGSLILARYDHRHGSIEAYRLIARHGIVTSAMWEHNPEVFIHAFNPGVILWQDDPVIKLDLEGHNIGNRVQKELEMETGTPSRSIDSTRSSISFCQPIASLRQDPSMALWPPPAIPAVDRVRNESANNFRDDAHRPQTLANASTRTFRLRKGLNNISLPRVMPSFSALFRIPETVMTYSTLLEESSTPTKTKPYQGIWVGDYSAHGCEFLLVLQKETPSHRMFSRLPSTSSGLPEGMSISEGTCEQAKIEKAPAIETATNDTPSSIHKEVRADHHCSGSLEAIKLTGDANIPRGEYTWIVEDIGDDGLIRIADEKMFSGARIVKSWGHVADRGFQNDRFISSQLIMISHDTLAQYWEVCDLSLSFFETVLIPCSGLVIYLFTGESTSTST